MRTAYDPARIRELSTRTVAAIDALSVIGSNDPAAADAIRTVRLLRRNLEDLWMPLLRQIEASRAMLTWTASAAGSVMEILDDGRDLLVEWIEDHDEPTLVEQLRSMTDAELLQHLRFLGTDGLPLDDGYALDLGDEHWVASFTPVAAEMARRVNRDATFAGQARQRRLRQPGRRSGHRTGGVPRRLHPRRRSSPCCARRRGWTTSPRAAEAAAATSVLATLTASPAHALAVLQDPVALVELSSWPFLDQGVVAGFVYSGLYDAVAADPARLRDGYGVLAGLTRLANGALDDGFAPGMARGVANSMIGYVDTLGRGIGLEDGGDVRVTTIGEHPFTIELGTYEEVRNLFGAVARDVEAQAALGVVLGAYMNTVIDEVGPDLAERSGVEGVAQFADLLGDAVTAEQAEMIAAATADAAQRGVLAGAIGFGSTAVASSFGGGPLVGVAVSRIVEAGTDRMTRIDAETMPDGMLRHVAYDSIIVATVTLGRTDRATQDSHRLHDDDAAELQPDRCASRAAGRARCGRRCRGVPRRGLRHGRLHPAAHPAPRHVRERRALGTSGQRTHREPRLTAIGELVTLVPGTNVTGSASGPRTEPRHGNLSPCRSAWSDSDGWVPTWCAGFTPADTSVWCTT